MSRRQHALELKLSELSAEEMVAALGFGSAGPMVRKVLGWPFWMASRPIGRTLAQFDLDTTAAGLSRAAASALDRFGVRVQTSGDCPGSGPLVVLSNHPGAYDALALMSAANRPDLLVIAADRTFLRALPAVSQHLLFVPSRVAPRALVLRRAYAHLRRGGALLHFAAGTIEPDPDFLEEGGVPLAAWEAGAIGLVRAAARVSGHIVVAGVRGVHSPLAKRLLVTRWAEKRGVTTVAPLVQVLAHYTDVNVHVTFGAAELATALAAMGDSRQILEHLRKAMLHALS
jgi:1-acyl-sn-glycerol-3-phosphate acyltransferase